jgi:hypothetical protein
MPSTEATPSRNSGADDEGGQAAKYEKSVFHGCAPAGRAAGGPSRSFPVVVKRAARRRLAAVMATSAYDVHDLLDVGFAIPC